MTDQVISATMWAYPWDLLDDGVDRALGRIQDTGMDAVSVATSYHSIAQLRPHAPHTRFFATDEAAVYFRPNPSCYRDTPLQPHYSPWCAGDDPLARIGQACARLGLDVISWTVCLHNSFLGKAHPDLVCQNVFGDRYTSSLCPSHPAVRAYLCGLARDLSSRGILRLVELESAGFGGMGHGHGHQKVGFDLGATASFLLGLCFCDACVSRGRAAGVDTEATAGEVRSRVESVLAQGQPLPDSIDATIADIPGLAALVQVREATVTSLIEEVRQASAVPINVMTFGRWSSGIVPSAVAPLAERMEVLCYTAQSDQVTERLKALLTEMGPHGQPDRVVVGLQAYPPAASAAATLVANVRAARQVGVRAFSFYNYGIMPLPCLAWVQEAMTGAKEAATVHEQECMSCP